MRFPFSRRRSIEIGLALVFVGLVAGAYRYLSTHRINLHITSRVFILAIVMVIVIVFVVLPVYSVIVTHEIRKRRRVEKALVQAKEEAERASKFKDQFLSTMSHELRTPLNAIMGFSDLLSDKRCGELNERQKRYVGHITTGGKHLVALINDILDLSRIEAGRMELSCEDLSVAHIFGEVVSALRPLAEKRSHTLFSSAERGLAVRADATRLKQVLMNLAGNAIKFTPEGGRIELAALPEGQRVRVKVTDNGPGIPEEEQKRIFDAFYRLRNSESAEGTGLGLAITESLVKLQGGTLALESTPGKGSCFHFSLPIGAAVLKPPVSRGKGIKKSRPQAKVLIIEDDPTTVHLIESQLTSSGYEAYICKQPERALELAAELQPEAITLDLLMKPTSGWEILLGLKNDVRTMNIPVIVVTIVDHPAAGAILGADEYLVKPVDRKTLLEAVERCVGRREGSAPARRILVVEDDAATREVIVELLNAKGYPVQGVADGESARTEVAASLPELVILDLMLPQVSGFELLAEWRADLRTAGLPVFVLTSKDLTSKEKNYLQEHTQSLFHKQESWQASLMKQLQRAVEKPQVART